VVGHDAKLNQDMIITSRMSISAPPELFRIDIQKGNAVALHSFNRDLLYGIKMGKVEKRMVKATDGKSILTWVILPPDYEPGKKYPALLYCQGGPQSMVGQFWSYRWNFQLMAAKGYVVVAPNRRGLPGFGSAWNDQISGDWGGQAMQDLLSAIDSVSNENYVDKNRLGAVGASFGGYSVYWLAGNHNKRFKAFISHNGVFDMKSMIATEEQFFYEHENKGYWWENPSLKAYSTFSPIDYISKWDTPILIIANEKDYRVPYNQGLEAFTAARIKGVQARLLSYPDENHWVLKPQNSVMWQRVFFDWLDKYLK
jgi:dipeptidyl aminopeptidase/acylaminoacyl peptidase